MTRHPSCWSPPLRLPDLPAGEAVREWPVEVWGAPTRFPPPCAPGFSSAQRLGLLPPPAPAYPPRPVPGWSSWDRVRWGLGLCLGLFGVTIVLTNSAELGWLGVPLVATPFLGGVWLVVSTGGRDVVEFGAGYTSGQAHVGLWRVAPDGRVLREPDRSVLPPGWYPSPYYAGLLQCWDGPGWKPLPQHWWWHESTYFRRPERPFL